MFDAARTIVSHPPLGRRPALATVALAFTILGCGPLPEDAGAGTGTETPPGDVETAVQNLEPMTVLSAMATVFGKMVETGNAFDAANELDRRFRELEGQIHNLGVDVANVTYESRRQAVLEMTRDLDTVRAELRSALRFSDQGEAWGAADALSQSSWYYFAGRTVNSPDRYDPRMAVPSYIEAVTTLVAIRRKLGLSPTDPSFQWAMADFVFRLQDKANKIWEANRCYDEQRTRTINRRPECYQYTRCEDDIAEKKDSFNTRSTVGRCDTRSEYNFDISRGRARKYGPEELQDIASQWWAHIQG